MTYYPRLGIDNVATPAGDPHAVFRAHLEWIGSTVLAARHMVECRNNASALIVLDDLTRYIERNIRERTVVL